MKTNETIKVLFERRTIRNFSNEKVSDEERQAIEKAGQQAPTSRFLNGWSAIRVEDPALKKAFVEITHQPYVGQAPLLYIFLVDMARNREIAKEQGDDENKIQFSGSHSFFQGYQDAVLALSAMMTAAESFNLGSVVLGSILFDISRVIELLHLPPYTFPVLGLAIGHIAKAPALKPRMPSQDQIFVNSYPSKKDWSKELADFSKQVGQYVDVRHPDQTIPPFLDSIKRHALEDDTKIQFIKEMAKQGFKID